MRSKNNINKIKQLCKKLSDRDYQLKINTKTLWMILEKVDETNQKIDHILEGEKGCSELAKSKLEEVSLCLDEIKNLANDRGCKRVLSHE
tara:strand:- start:5721 stop:5990 length:270 start_codon:yes stop_codon:yes gene_type:complete